MNILYGISVIVLSLSFFHEAEGQATCALSWDDGSELENTYWDFGYFLDSIEDVTPPGTVLINMTASYITSISSTAIDSASGYLFMQPVLENGRFIVTLTDYFTQYEELESLTRIRLTVTFVCSVNTRSLEINQPITDTNNHYPEFQNAPYIYSLPIPLPPHFPVQLFGAISARDVDLTNTNISFTLNSSDPNSAGFSASWLSQDTTDTKLHYAQLLTAALLRIEETITFNIYATDNGVPSLTSITNITINIDEENSTPNSPVFTHNLYIADHSDITLEEASGTLILFKQGNVSLSQGADNTVNYTIYDNIGNYEDFFLITPSEDYSFVSLTLQNVTEEFLAEKYVILTVTATRSGATDPGVTILHIDLPGIICEACSTTTERITTVVPNTDPITTTWGPITTESITTSVCPEVTECPTSTTEECACDCSTTTATSYTTTPTYQTQDIITTIPGNADTTIPSITNPVTAQTTECPVVTVTQECDCTDATTLISSTGITDTSSTLPSESNSSETTTPSSENPGSGTTPVSTENDTLITTTTIATPSLSFPNSIYRFEKDSTFTGVLMTQTAVVTNAAGTIVYAVNIDDDDLASRILMDSSTAELEVTATISPGIYTFQIVATIAELSLSTSATVVLVISTLTECSGENVFGYALQVIEIEEESIHEDVFPLDDNGCSYTIYSQNPNQDLFFINGSHLNTVAIDREASYFSNMSVAQVRVTIDANCPNETTANQTTITRSKRDTEYEVLSGNIAYIRTRTILVAIITDINDNAPVWSSNTPNYIGFPNYNLAQLIKVPYAYQFLATDADIDDNAIVSYTLPSGSDEYFYIHGSTGTLYIQQGVYVEDDLQLTLIATDGQFETRTELIVKALESNNVAVLFVNGGVLEDVENILEELSTSTGYWIQSLGSNVVSEIDSSSLNSSRSSRSTRANDVNTLLRLVLYGLYNNEPVTSETIVSSVEDFNTNWDIINLVTLDSLLNDSAITGPITTSETLGYWAAIIVLSLILFLLIIAAGVLYFLFLRRKKGTSTGSDVTYENFNNPNEGTGNHFVKAVTLKESRDRVSESTDSANADWILIQLQNSKKLSNENNRAFSSSKGYNTGEILVVQNEDETDVSPNLSKRKSVAFNDTVEEIEVARL